MIPLGAICHGSEHPSCRGDTICGLLFLGVWWGGTVFLSGERGGHMSAWTDSVRCTCITMTNVGWVAQESVQKERYVCF